MLSARQASEGALVRIGRRDPRAKDSPLASAATFHELASLYACRRTHVADSRGPAPLGRNCWPQLFRASMCQCRRFD